MDDGCVEMASQLLAAAERFDMARFKLVCEQMISESLDEETVAATLVLADRYKCAGLKNSCIEFLVSGGIMNDVARTEGYALLKRDNPYLLVEVLGKASKLGKI
jgi:speckle-type POZ protein